MSPKNLNASKKTHKLLLKKLKDKEIFELYNKFEKEFKLKEDFIVAISGGPDSLALSFLTKVYSIKKSLKVKYFIVDHKLRKNSTTEARFVKNLLKEKLSAELSILTWNGKKPKSNIQSIAREKRYSILTNQAKKLKINNILLGHHNDDLIENFFIRILRGSGLNGLISLDKKSDYKKVNLIRPLLKFTKQDLKDISEKIFETYIQDPSNKNDKFKRVKIRNFLENLQSEGLDLDKFNLTIKNLKIANDSINFFTEKNLRENVIMLKKKNSMMLNRDFFSHPEEVVFRSLTEVIKIIGKRFYPVRGKKIAKIVKQVKNNSLTKATLGNCIIKLVNNSIIVSKEY